MPGIKSTRIGAARVPLGRLGLAALMFWASHHSLATEPGPGIHALEWNGGSDNFPAADDVQDINQEAGARDLWQRVRDGFRIDDQAAANPLTAVHESWYAARPEHLRRVAERARRYLFYIVEEVERRGMPMEIALLPMIESAFDPAALSSSAASGIWQFIPSTGRLYGLKQDKWYDGRRDFTAATGAALDYLGKLYLDFGDWQLALAAYNCGEGCVARAIQKNVRQGLPTDYASLALPNETRHYVPKLLAIRNLVRNPEQHGMEIDDLPNEPYFNQVTVSASMDLHSAARLADMSSEEFIALNAAFPRKLIRSDTPVNLLVPVDRADRFQRNLEVGDWDSWQPYAARKGERPEAIARRFKVSLARLTEHNQFNLRRGRLVRAQTVLVPVKRRGTGTAANNSGGTRPTPTEHEVKAGDTLYGVARRYGLSARELADADPGVGRLRPGQVLRLAIPASSPRETAPLRPRNTSAREAMLPSHYAANRGDTLLTIARRFDISTVR
ncbi:MAG: transglycosylase SLT domain-containing protein [Thiobacillus sp.]